MSYTRCTCLFVSFHMICLFFVLQLVTTELERLEDEQSVRALDVLGAIGEKERYNIKAHTHNNKCAASMGSVFSASSERRTTS